MEHVFAHVSEQSRFVSARQKERLHTSANHYMYMLKYHCDTLERLYDPKCLHYSAFDMHNAQFIYSYAHDVSTTRLTSTTLHDSQVHHNVLGWCKLMAMLRGQFRNADFDDTIQQSRDKRCTAT